MWAAILFAFFLQFLIAIKDSRAADCRSAAAKSADAVLETTPVSPE